MTVVKSDFPFVSFTIYGEFLLRVLNELWFVSSRHLAILIFGDWLPQVNGFVESSTVYCRGSQMCQHRDDVDNSNLFYPKLIQYPHWLVFFCYPGFLSDGVWGNRFFGHKESGLPKLQDYGFICGFLSYLLTIIPQMKHANSRAIATQATLGFLFLRTN